MQIPRRTFLHRTAAFASMSALMRPVMTRPAMALLGERPEQAPPIEDQRLRELTEAAISSAISAGASYVDVRLVHQFGRNVVKTPFESEALSVGVRVVVDGYWGFASSPLWSVVECVRLGRDAVRQAKANTLGQIRDMTLAPVTPVRSGHWETPIKEDPFTISRDELEDFLRGIGNYIGRQSDSKVIKTNLELRRDEIVFASSLGHFITQRRFLVGSDIALKVTRKGQVRVKILDSLTPAGMGFEHLRDQPIRQQIDEKIAEAKEELSLPVMPVDVGRYDIVLDASTVAHLLVGGIGAATQWDRVAGYEANADGTSYIVDPAEMIGSFKVGSELVNITANRTEVGGAATTKWDDEGVPATEFQLVSKGILTDLQTNREGSGYLADVYRNRNLPLESRGCAYSPNALLPPLTHTPNIQLRPGSNDESFETLVKGLSNGIQFKAGFANMDFQQGTGLLLGSAIQIKNGKRAAVLAAAGITFRTSELWNGVIVLGGQRSMQRVGLQSMKGQPHQDIYSTYSAPPMSVKEMTVIDVTRKA